MTAIDGHKTQIDEALDLLPPSAAPGQVFTAPWQARIFALIVELVKQGHLPWTEFQSRLAKRITDSSEPMVDMSEQVEDHYFDCWLEAVQQTLEEEGFIRDHDVIAKIADLKAAAEEIRQQQLQGEVSPTA